MTRVPSPSRQPANLGRELGGDLKCVYCGYNLKGISIRNVCPECGVAVRATILAVVDPLAGELQPIRYRHIVAAGLVLWSSTAALAALSFWIPHINHLLNAAGLSFRLWIPFGKLLPLGLIALSGFGSIALIRPHAQIKPAHVSLAACGFCLYVFLTYFLWLNLSSTWPQSVPTYLSHWFPQIQESLPKMIVMVLVAGIMLCLRPNARLLVARSLVMRQGRVDRQTLLVMVFAALIVAFGHLLGSLPGLFNLTRTTTLAAILSTIGLVFVVLGSLFLTLGMMGSIIDTIRIAKAILLPNPSIRKVLRGDGPS